jgi:hypothetical protein
MCPTFYQHIGSAKEFKLSVVHCDVIVRTYTCPDVPDVFATEFPTKPVVMDKATIQGVPFPIRSISV